MNNSEITAIVAIVVSGLTSIITMVVGYLQNKANNRAKLSEIAFEKRLEAFREIYEAVTKLNYMVKLLIDAHITHGELEGLPKPKLATNISSPLNTLDQAKDGMIKAVDTFNEVYAKHRVFLPPHMDNILVDYRKALDESAEELARFRLKQVLQIDPDYEERLTDLAVRLTSEAHKFIGYT